MLKRIISLIMCVVMVIGIVPPMAVRAEETESTQAVTESVEKTTKTNTEVTEDPVMLIESGITSETELSSSDAMRSSTISGTCGENLTWELDENGWLHISGTGAMDSWENSEDRPWYSVFDDISIVTIEEGVTSIGSMAFAECVKLSFISIPQTLVFIGKTLSRTVMLCYQLITMAVRTNGMH